MSPEGMMRFGFGRVISKLFLFKEIGCGVFHVIESKYVK